MKKLLTLLCTLLLLFTLTGCTKPEVSPRRAFKNFVKKIAELFHIDKDENEALTKTKIEVSVPHLSIDYLEDQDIAE